MRTILTLIRTAAFGLLVVTVAATASAADRFELKPDDLPSQVGVVKGTVLVFTGQTPLDTQQTVEVRIGGSVRSTVTATGAWKLAWDTSGEQSSANRVTVVAKGTDGQESRLTESTVDLLDKSPYQVSVAGKERIAHGPTQINISPAAKGDAIAVDYSIDGQVIASSSKTDGAATWDTWLELPGKRAVRAILKTDGRAFITPPLEVTIAPAVEIKPLDLPKGKLTLVENSVVPIKATMAVTAPVKTVEYRIDGKLISQRTTEPFDSIDWKVDPSIKDGSHRLTVGVSDKRGRMVQSAPMTVDLALKRSAGFAQNDEPIVITATGRDPQAATVNVQANRDRGRFDFEALRKQAAMVQPYSGRRSGKVGTANGLAIRVLADDDDEIYVAGVMHRIEAAYTAGKGDFKFLADSAADAKVAGETAFAYAKKLAEEHGHRVDWTKFDVSLQNGGGHRIEGGSAGITDCAALYSTIMGLAVDSSVAMSGAIGLHGDVKPVGGIYFKAESALGDAAIRTLILPATEDSLDELVDLAVDRPEIFAGKRVIFAQNMEQVLRQALIGFDEKTLGDAERHFVAALQAFGRREDLRALNEMLTASKLTPENATIGIWYQIVKAARGK